jgi:hypothetical protein
MTLGDADDSEGKSEASAKSESSEDKSGDESKGEVGVKAQENLAHLTLICNSM